MITSYRLARVKKKKKNFILILFLINNCGIQSIFFLCYLSTKLSKIIPAKDELCMWYVEAVVKPEHGLWMVTSYRGPHSYIPLGMTLDGRMMDCNFLAAEFVPLLQEKHTATIYHLA